MPDHSPVDESATTRRRRLRSITRPRGGIALPFGDKARYLFQTKAVQLAVAAVILFNFFAIVIEKEIDPYSTEHQRYPLLWSTIDDVCNIIFLFELALNLYGHWWRPFLRSGWNYLDSLVVLVGITSLARIDLGVFAKIKIIRAFRILRLFKRVKSLNQIILAIVRSIPGVLNAFMVMVSIAITRLDLPSSPRRMRRMARACAPLMPVLRFASLVPMSGLCAPHSAADLHDDLRNRRGGPLP